MAGKARRSFAVMDPEQQRAIARLGGQVAHERGTAHEFTREEARHAGKLGGWVVSRNRQHMARLGRLGVETKRRKRAEEEKGNRS